MSYFEELLEKLKTTTNKSTKNTTKKRKDEDYFDRIVSKVASLAEEKRTAQEDDIAPTKVGGGGRSFDDTSSIKTRAKLDTDGKRASSLTDKESILDSLASHPLLGGSATSMTLQQRQREKETEQAKGTGLIREKQRTWFNGDALGVFRDGYQLGDVSKILLGTGQDVADDLTAGALGIGESVVDTAAYGIGAVADLFGHPTAKVTTEEFIKKDLYDEVEVAKTINQSPAKMILRLLGVDDAEDTSALGEKSDSLSQSGGQLLGQVALQSVGVPWYVTSGATSFGSEAENALEQGASFSDAGWSAAISAGAEILTEKMFGGSGLGEKGLINVNSLTEGITNKAYKALADYGIDILGEGTEEVASEFISRLGQQLTYEKEATWEELLSDEEAMDQYINQFTENLFGREAREAYGESFVGGSVLGGTMNVGNVRNSVKNETDYRTGLTADDQTVFDKVLEEAIAKAEKDGKKLTKNEKAELYDSVMEDLENGSIDVDDIERILGGDSYTEFESGVKGFNESELYKAYRDAVKEESDIKTEFDELSKVKANEADLGQQARFTDLQKKLEEMKTNAKSKELRTQLQPEIDRINSIKARLRSEVSGRVKEGKLSESYRELLRSTEKFTADVSKYENEDARQTVQNIIDSGIVDNSNKMHTFVDFMAKISEDKGVIFSATDAKKLAGTVHDMKGAVANAFVEGKNITINWDTKKRKNSLVGHEITHVLEGTEFYNQLAETVKQYATAKGEWDSRLKATTELYQKYDPKADPEKELIADLVGDYVFTDSKFVNNLSTKNRNVFQKVYDEIKYLLKIATAGSEEARALEKVRKVFEKAWRSQKNTAEDSGVKYDIAALDNGNVYVKASRNVITGQTKAEQRKNITEFFNDLLEGNPSLDIQTIEGDVLTITKAETADKARDDYKVIDGQRIPMTDGEFVAKLHVESHIDEVAEVSKPVGKKGDNKNHPFAKDGFTYRRAYFEDFDGQYYEVTLSIGNNGTVATVYNVGKIEGSVLPSAKLIAVVGSKPLGKTLPANDITQETQKVKGKFSLSDSNGNQLTDAQAEFFKGSKVVDESGNLKVVYHGSTAHFTEFSLKYLGTNGTAEGYGFYFTDKKNIAEAYSHGTEAQRHQGADGKLFEVYLDIKKPLSDTEVTMSRAQFKKFLIELNKQVDEDGEPLDILSNYGDVEWEGLGNVINSVMEVEYDGSDSDVNMIHSIINACGDARTVFDVLRKTTGYDGIIVNEATWGDDQTIYVAFHPNQIKNVDNLSPTNHPDIRKSISPDNYTDPKIGGYAVYGGKVQNPSDLGFNPLGDDIAPIAENVQNTAQNTMNNVQENTNVPFDAPVQAGDAEAVNDISTITDADAPPVMEAPMPDNEPVKPHDPFAEKNIEDVGKRNVHAYMSDHPEVKPYFQQEANIMLGELRDTVKGERIYNEEGGWTGTSRHTSEDIAYLRDALGYTYAEIEKGLNAIIEDHGKENIAVAKKIEFILNDRLLKGYRDFATGMDIPANESYIKLLNNGQMMSYDDGYMDALVASEPPPAEFDAPVMTQPVAQPKAPVQGDIAPTHEYEAIRPQQPNQPKMIRVDAPVAEQHTAQILTEAKAKPKEKFNALHKAVELLVDKGAVFERLSKETKNRELEAKYNYLHYSNGNAQNFIGNGNPEKGVSSLTSIMEQVGERSEDFFSYLYHIHNADRMTLEQRGFGDNKAVFGSHVSADMSNAIWRQIERTNPDFRQLATQVYGINQYLRQMMVDGGLISQDTANLWSQMYPHYVPISRADYEAMAVNVPLDTNKTGVNAPVKMATGGDSDISPLFNTMAKRILQTYRAVDKNSFGVELMNTLGKVNEKTATDFDAVMDGIDAHEELLQEGKNGNSPTFTVFENGERTTFDITNEMYDAMKPTSDALAYTNKFLNGLSNFRRGLITEYNPVFLATNAIKDAQDVLINSQHPMKTYANFPRAWAEMIGNGKWYKEYMTHGGGENTYFDRVSDSFDTKEKGLRKLLGVPPISWIGKANNFLERVPRLAEYIASRESDRSIEVSMLDAARVTTNFAAGGDATKFLNRNGFTFLNASVQGAAQQVRNVQEAIAEGKKGVLKLVGKTVMAGLPALLLNHLLWDDDEEYEELSDYVKENYYIVGKFGDGQFVRIPKGRTVAVIQEAFQQMKGAMTGDDDIDFMKWAKLAFSNLAPNDPLNNFVASPIIQASTNKAWHGGDIVPQSLQDVPVEEQYDEGTDMFSRWVGDVFNISPMKVNYVLDQYSGGIGDTFLPMMTPEAERGGDSIVGKLVSPWVDKFTTDSVLNNQNVTDFYDLKDKLTINANSSKATDEDMLYSKYMNSVNSELSDLYKEKREIQNSRKYSDSEKFEMVRDIQEQINERMKDAMSTYEDVAYETDAKTGEKYAVIGDKYFKLTDEEHEYEWSILSKEQTEKYKITSAAGDANYATDGKTHYAWSEPDEDDLDGKPQWRKLTDKQVAKQEDVTKKLGITPEEYWADRDEDTVKMYDWVYENPEKYEVSRAVAKDFKDYWQYKSDLDSLDAKDANGKSVNGLKKERVIDYINQMDADYGERIVLFRSYYPKDDTYNADIVEYLNNRNDISYTQMVKILTELDMKVHADGTVTWD